MHTQLVYPGDASLPLGDNINDYKQIASLIKNKNIAKLFSDILEQKETLEKEILENKKLLRNWKYDPIKIRILLSIVIISCLIISSGCIYGMIRDKMANSSLPFALICAVALAAIPVPLTFCIFSYRNGKSILSSPFTQMQILEKVYPSKKLLLDQLIDLDNSLNSDKKKIIKDLLKICDDYKSSDTKSDDILSCMLPHFPNHDIIQTYISIICSDNKSMLEHEQAWKNLETDLEIPINYLKVDNINYYNPKNHLVLMNSKEEVIQAGAQKPIYIYLKRLFHEFITHFS